MTYGYYAEIVECEKQIALKVYGTDEVDYYQARELQKFFDTKEILESFHIHRNWTLAIDEYIVKHGINMSPDGHLSYAHI